MNIKSFGLNGNQLKILALLIMTVDHIGMILFPYATVLRIIGRLAYPIFAFMIAEGCRYTKNRKKYLLSVAAVAFVCQMVYLIAMKSLYMCIFVTFTFSIILIYTLDFARDKKKLWAWALAALVLLAVIFIAYVVPRKFPIRDFRIDYGIVGILVPVFIYIGRNKWEKLLLAAFILLLLCIDYRWVQWYCLLALPLIALYNGERGKLKMKYLFYLYYPLHLVALHFLSYVI